MVTNIKNAASFMHFNLKMVVENILCPCFCHVPVYKHIFEGFCTSASKTVNYSFCLPCKMYMITSSFYTFTTLFTKSKLSKSHQNDLSQELMGRIHKKLLFINP